MKSNGELVGPSDGSLKIENQSVFGIHVSQIAATEVSPFNVVADASAATEDNSFDMQLIAGSETVDLATAGATLARSWPTPPGT